MWTPKALAVLGATTLAALLAATFSNATLAVFSAAGMAYLALGSVRGPTPRLEVTKEFHADRFFEGDEAEVAIHLHNAGLRTGLIEFRDRLPDAIEVTSGASHGVMSLRSRASIDWSYQLRSQRKGAYSVGPVQYRTYGPFDLFAAEHAVVGTERAATVYPRRERITSLFVRSFRPKAFLGSNPVRQAGMGSEFYALREYRPGDRQRDVNWKATQRATGGRSDGDLIVNQPERESVADIFLFLDARAASAIGRADRNAFIWGCRASSTLAAFLSNQRDRISLTLYGDRLEFIPPGTGEAHLYNLYGRLTDTEPHGDVSMMYAVTETLPRLKRGSPVIMISSLEDDPTVFEAISTLRTHDTVVTVISPNAPDLAYEEGLVDEPTYRLMRLKRHITISELRSYGVRVLDWTPEKTLAALLQEVVT